MNTITKRLAYKLWPPYEAKVADQHIEKRMNIPERWETILTEVRNSIPKDASNDAFAELELLANGVEKAESDRFKTIEGKASAFSSGITIVLGIMAAVGTLFKDYQFDWSWLVILLGCYLLIIIHLLVAAYHAAKVRRVTKIAYFSTNDLISSMKNNQWHIKDRIVFTLGRTKWNEDVIIRKANYLFVSEQMYWRGVILIAFLAILLVLIRAI